MVEGVVAEATTG